MEQNKNFRLISTLLILGGGGYAIYKIGDALGWWISKKDKLLVELEWAFLYKLPLEIGVQDIQNLYIDRFNTMKGKKWPIKKVKSITPANQSIYFPKIYDYLNSATTINEFKNALNYLPYQYNYAQFNDWLMDNHSKVMWDFLNDQLKDQEISDVVSNTFLKKDAGVAFFTDKSGNAIWEKNLWIYK